MSTSSLNRGDIVPKKSYVKADGTWRNVKTAWLNVGGVWRKFVPKGNIAGVWKEFIQYMMKIYELGTEYVQIVPGYSEPWSGNQTTKNADHLYLEARSSWANINWGVVSFVTDKPIDVTPYSKMFITWTVTTAGGSAANFGLVTSKTTKSFTVVGGSVSASNATQQIDISSLRGNFHPIVLADGREPISQNGNVKIMVHKIWLE